ncbi:MAG: hypothetical protein WA432_04920 [Candidatus Babeliaceae bacterium]
MKIMKNILLSSYLLFVPAFMQPIINKAIIKTRGNEQVIVLAGDYHKDNPANLTQIQDIKNLINSPLKQNLNIIVEDRYPHNSMSYDASRLQNPDLPEWKTFDRPYVPLVGLTHYCKTQDCSVKNVENRSQDKIFEIVQYLNQKYVSDPKMDLPEFEKVIHENKQNIYTACLMATLNIKNYQASLQNMETYQGNDLQRKQDYQAILEYDKQIIQPYLPLLQSFPSNVCTSLKNKNLIASYDKICKDTQGLCVQDGKICLINIAALQAIADSPTKINLVLMGASHIHDIDKVTNQMGFKEVFNSGGPPFPHIHDPIDAFDRYGAHTGNESFFKNLPQLLEHSKSL